MHQQKHEKDFQSRKGFWNGKRFWTGVCIREKVVLLRGWPWLGGWVMWGKQWMNLVICHLLPHHYQQRSTWIRVQQEEWGDRVVLTHLSWHNHKLMLMVMTSCVVTIRWCCIALSRLLHSVTWHWHVILVMSKHCVVVVGRQWWLQMVAASGDGGQVCVWWRKRVVGLLLKLFVVVGLVCCHGSQLVGLWPAITFRTPMFISR